MIKYYPSHNIDDLIYVKYITKGLYGETILLMDASTRGTKLTKLVTIARELIDNMTHN